MSYSSNDQYIDATADQLLGIHQLGDHPTTHELLQQKEPDKIGGCLEAAAIIRSRRPLMT